MITTRQDGTPKTLREAIRLEICIGPLRTVEQRLIDSVLEVLVQRAEVCAIRHPGSREAFSELLNQLKEECKLEVDDK